MDVMMTVKISYTDVSMLVAAQVTDQTCLELRRCEWRFRRAKLEDVRYTACCPRSDTLIFVLKQVLMYEVFRWSRERISVDILLVQFFQLLREQF